MPENPVNAIAIRVEVIRTIGIPWKYFGMSLPSILSRMLARITIAMV